MFGAVGVNVHVPPPQEAGEAGGFQVHQVPATLGALPAPAASTEPASPAANREKTTTRRNRARRTLRDHGPCCYQLVCSWLDEMGALNCHGALGACSGLANKGAAVFPNLKLTGRLRRTAPAHGAP